MMAGQNSVRACTKPPPPLAGGGWGEGSAGPQDPLPPAPSRTGRGRALRAMTATPVFGAPEGWDAFLLARRRGEFAGPVLHVTRDDSRMARLAEALAFVVPEAEVLRFPAWDCLPYDRVSPNPALVSERIATLARLLEKPTRPRIVLTTVNALVQRVPPGAAFAGASLELRTNGTVQPEKLARFLEATGYGRAGTVMEPGEYAMRGGIIDIFPAGEADPIRLDLFGDTIESIRTFDPGTQRSADRRQRLILRPVSEVPLDPDAISRFRSGWRESFGQPAAEDPIYLSISEGRRHPGMEHWVPLFHDRMETLLDYLPGASVSLDHQADEVLAARLEMIADHYAARRMVPRDGEVPYRPLPPDRLYLDQAGWEAMLAGGPLFAFSPFAKPDGAVGVDGGGRPGPVFFQSGGGPGTNVFDQLRAQTERWNGEGKRIVVAAWTRGSRERIANLLREHGFKDAAQQDDWAAVRRRPVGSVSLVTLGVERGFVADQLALVGEQDLLGERISRPPRRRQRADQFIAEATEIAEGDLVVHQEYGIGRYDGLETLTVTERAARLPAADLRRRGKAVPAGREHRGAVALRQRGAGRRAGQAGRRRLAVAQGADEAAHPRHGGSAHPHRRGTSDPRRRDHGAGRGRVGRVLRALPVRRDRGPGARHRRCAGGPGVGPADGPADLRRRRLRQDRGRVARGVHRGDVGRAGRRGGADHAAGAAAFPHVLRALCRAAGDGRAALAHGAGEGGGGGAPRHHRRLGQHRHRHPCAAGEVGGVRRSRPAGGGRGAAFRRRAQGAAEAAQGRRARADADRDADPAHLAARAVRRARDERDRHPAGGSAGGAHLHHAVRRRGDPRGAAARAVPRRPGVLRGAAHRGPAAHGGAADRDRARGAHRARAWPAGADRARTGDDRVRRRPLRHPAVHQHRRERSRHAGGEHAGDPSRRHVRPRASCISCAAASGAASSAATRI